MSPKPRAYGLELGATKPDAEPRPTFDKSPVRESRTPGSVGEALRNQRLYPTIFVWVSAEA
jgi:hypothetical protein